MYLVDEALCNGCGICLALCSAEAIRIERGTAVIDQERCTECGHCFDGCLRNAVFELQQPATAPRPMTAYAAGSAVAVSHSGAIPKESSWLRSPATREKAGSVLTAALPVILKLAGALADHLAARASHAPGTGSRGIASSGTPGAGRQFRHHGGR